MAYGIEVRNNQGGVQIDGTYQNLSLLETGRTATSSSFDSYAVERFFVPWNFDLHPEAIVTVRPRPGEKIFKVSSEPNNNRFVIESTGVSSYVDYAIYGIQKSTKSYSTNYGLQILNGSGDIVFDSREKYLKVLGYVDINSPSESIVTANNPYASQQPYIMHPIGHVRSVIVGEGGTTAAFRTWISFNSGGDIRLENTTPDDIDRFRVFLVRPPS